MGPHRQPASPPALRVFFGSRLCWRPSRSFPVTAVRSRERVARHRLTTARPPRCPVGRCGATTTPATRLVRIEDGELHAWDPSKPAATGVQALITDGRRDALAGGYPGKADRVVVARLDERWAVDRTLRLVHRSRRPGGARPRAATSRLRAAGGWTRHRGRRSTRGPDQPARTRAGGADRGAGALTARPCRVPGVRGHRCDRAPARISEPALTLGSNRLSTRPHGLGRRSRGSRPMGGFV